MCAKNIPDFNNLFSEYYAHILYVCSTVLLFKLGMQYKSNTVQLDFL